MRKMLLAVPGFLMMLCGLIGAAPALCDEIEWVGYQGCADGAQTASFHHGDNWFNFLVPGPTDHALFGSGFDPQGNGVPRIIYFGDFCVQEFPCPNSYYIPTEPAIVREFDVQNENWTFDFEWASWGGCNPPEHRSGTLAAEVIIIGSQVQTTGLPGNATVTMRNGEISCTDVRIGGFPGSNGTLNIEGTQLTVSAFLDVHRGMASIRAGATVIANVIRAGDGDAGSTRYLFVSGTGTECQVEHLAIGNGGSGRVVVSEGADIDCGFLKMGDYDGQNSSCRVTDPGTSVILPASSYIPMWADALLEIDNRGYVYTPSLEVDHGRILITDEGNLSGERIRLGQSGHPGSVDISGVGSLWTLTQDLNVGAGGLGSLTVHQGAEVQAGWAHIPQGDLGSGEATIEDSGSALRVAGEVRVGDAATGILRVLTGATLEAHPLIIGPFGSLIGDGSVQGDMLNTCVVAPGASPGILEVSGDYGQTESGRLQIEIAGTDPGNEYDRLQVTGEAQLGGTLELILIDGYEPPNGTQFEVLSAVTVSGEFDEVTSNGGFFVSTYEPSRVVVTYMQTTDTPVGADPAGRSFDLTISGSNPIRYGEDLRVFLDTAGTSGPVRLDLLTVNGRTVGSWAPRLGETAQGYFTVPSGALKSFGSGVYFLRMQAPGAEKSKRIVVIR